MLTIVNNKNGADLTWGDLTWCRFDWADLVWGRFDLLSIDSDIKVLNHVLLTLQVTTIKNKTFIHKIVMKVRALLLKLKCINSTMSGRNPRHLGTWTFRDLDETIRY